MSQHQLKLLALEGHFAVCRLDPGDSLPAWARNPAPFSSVTRTREELSIVCPEAAVPEHIAREAGWRILQVVGPLDFAVTGILSSLAHPLAKAGISIFAISTFDTDYLMVKDDKLEEAMHVLAGAGHHVERE